MVQMLLPPAKHLMYVLWEDPLSPFVYVTLESDRNVCRELGIGIVSYSPLGRGFFSGKPVQEGDYRPVSRVSLQLRTLCEDFWGGRLWR
jgi:aryl-alcohol dehydrogenase-like predicted oxidoreductase